MGKNTSRSRGLSTRDERAIQLAASGGQRYGGPRYGSYDATTNLPPMAGGGRDQQRGPSIMGPMPPDANDLKRPQLTEYGATGVAIIAGVITSEEYNENLQWREWIRIAEKMRRSDPTIAQILSLLILPILAATYKVAPASPDPKHLEHASFAESSLMHDLDGQSFTDVLRQALIMLWAGFMIFEKVWKLNENGAYKWSQFAPRMPRTIYRWWEGADRRLVGVQQWAWNPATQGYMYVNIPAGNLLRFTLNQEGANYEGISVLRPCYGPWFMKQAFMKLMAVGFEKEHVGIPVVSLPEGYADDDIKRAQQIGRNVRSNEQAFVTLAPGWAIEWLKSRSPEKKGGGILDAIKYFDTQILNAVLAGFIMMGQAGTGSYAASTDQSTIFLKSLQAYARYICDVFSLDAIPQLLRYNYGPLDLYPRLIAQNIQAFSIKDLSRSLREVADAGLLRPSVEIEDYLYDMTGIPRPPANLVESTEDGKMPTGALRPDATGITPLPLTPEEEIAMANRMARDQQRITALKPGAQIGAQGDTGDTVRVGTSGAGNVTRRATTGGTQGVKAPDGAALIEMPDVYRTYLEERPHQRWSLAENTAQRTIYSRMAREMGRPRIRLFGDYQFVSAEPQPRFTIEQQKRIDRRRDLTGDLADELRGNFDQLRRDLMDAVSEHEHDEE